MVPPGIPPSTKWPIALSCFVGLMVVVYVLWSEDLMHGGNAVHHRPDALDVALAKNKDGRLSPQSRRAKRFLENRWVSSTAWSSPSNHHLPNLRRMLSSALSISDFGSSSMQEQLKSVLSIGDRGEPRITSATFHIKYKIDVSLFVRPEHRRRLRLWASRNRRANGGSVNEEQTGLDELTTAVIVVKSIPWNAAHSLSICEIVPLVTNKVLSCSEATRTLVQRLHEVTAKRKGPVPGSLVDAATMEQLMRTYFTVQQLSERHALAGAASRQSFLAVFNDGAHFATSPIGLTQQLCDGSRSGRELDLEAVKNQAVVSRAIWNQHLLEKHGSEIKMLLSEITESSTSLRAEELILTKVKIWDPIRANAEHGDDTDDGLAAHAIIQAEEGRIVPREGEALEMMFRPTVLCVMMTTFGDGLKLALLQFLLWGDQCDDFVIAVASSEANGQERLRRSFVDLQRVTRIRPDRLVHVRMTSDDIKRNLWLQFQLTIVALDDWTGLDHTFQYMYFATDDTFMIPENLYDLLMQPEWFTLHAANTPLLFGNAMWEPSEKVVYASSGPGIVMNNVALRLAVSLSPTDACRPKLVSNAWDVLLAKCLQSAGVLARDTADDIGEDRFHVLSLHWMLLAPTLVPSQAGDRWWYDEQRPRDDRAAKLLNPFRALSSSSIAFNKINTVEKALWMHMQLRHS